MGQSSGQWITPDALANPGNNIRRFGKSAQANVVGSGSEIVSMSLLKHIPLTKRIHIQLGAQVAKLFNHPNYAPPSDLTVGVPAFLQITSLQKAEGAGPCLIQLAGRVTFLRFNAYTLNR